MPLSMPRKGWSTGNTSYAPELLCHSFAPSGSLKGREEGQVKARETESMGEAWFLKATTAQHKLPQSLTAPLPPASRLLEQAAAAVARAGVEQRRGDHRRAGRRRALAAAAVVSEALLLARAVQQGATPDDVSLLDQLVQLGRANAALLLKSYVRAMRGVSERLPNAAMVSSEPHMGKAGESAGAIFEASRGASSPAAVADKTNGQGVCSKARR